MIYLKPIGGLCNRMRTIDSLITLCKIHKKDLTVLWVKDTSLNCNFSGLFIIPVFDEFKFEVIDCPVGFPENYLNKVFASKLRDESDIYLIRNLKNIFRGRFLSKRLRKIKNNLSKITDDEIIVNEELVNLYASEKYNSQTSAREMDANFIDISKTLSQPLIEDNNRTSYISSCYRLFPLENSYTSFVPISFILDKVESITSRFNGTVGLHIRRSDHKTSRKISTTEKFVKILDHQIESNDTSTFFLSTDDEETKNELLDRYKGRIIVNDVTSYDRNNSDAVIDAVVDLFCLSKTKKIYGSHHSSFSQTAADIGSLQEITAK